MPRLALAVLACAVLAAAAACSGSGAADGHRIVFWYDNPKPSIWVARPDGSHARLIVRNRQNAKRPRLSPDRRWVAFDGTPAGRPPLTDFDIQLVRLDGTGLRTLTHGRSWDVDAQWSPDGRRLAFTRLPPHPQDCSDASVWVMRRDGSGARRLAGGCGGRWSPDGKRLVYVSRSGHDLLVADASGGPPQTLLRTGESLQLGGWSSRDQIAYTASASSTGSSGQIFVVEPDGRDPRKVGDGYVGCWSPDGSKLLYTTRFQSPLHVMDADGSHRRVLARLVGAEPDWR